MVFDLQMCQKLHKGAQFCLRYFVCGLFKKHPPYMYQEISHVQLSNKYIRAHAHEKAYLLVHGMSVDGMG